MQTKQRFLISLLRRGFVVPADQEWVAEKYKLTDKAQQLLAERGVGMSGGRQTPDLRSSSGSLAKFRHAAGIVVCWGSPSDNASAW